MIISVEQAKAEIGSFKDWTDEKITRKLKAIEQAIRSYTHNNFQNRDYRRTADIVGGSFYVKDLVPFKAGDTVQVSESALNKGLYIIRSVDDELFEVDEDVKDEVGVLVTRIDYPEDVVECAFNLLQWELNHRDKVGVQSETLSRHSVTYFNMDGENSVMGYPKSLMGALKPYMKARF